MNIAKMIDHTLLKPTATEKDISVLCNQAKQYNFASVCVNPKYVQQAYNELKNTDIKVCTVIGFPLGSNCSEIKQAEAKYALLQGATELDMVIDISSVKNANWFAVEEDITRVVQIAQTHSSNRSIIVKVILETCYLTDDEIIKACIAAKNAKADFVKTSTGFGTPGKNKDGKQIPNGATVHHVKLMYKTVGDVLKIKASGGIKDKETAMALINAGASRIGTSSGITLL